MYIYKYEIFSFKKCIKWDHIKQSYVQSKNFKPLHCKATATPNWMIDIGYTESNIVKNGCNDCNTLGNALATNSLNNNWYHWIWLCQWLHSGQSSLVIAHICGITLRPL